MRRLNWERWPPILDLVTRLKGKESHTDYLWNGSRPLSHARTGRDRCLLCQWKILRVPDRVSRPFKGIDGHCVGRRDRACHLAGWEAGDVRHVACRADVRTLGVRH